ncbi:isochorismatase family cysteine hydrolase [Adlercreutzia sp. R21]|uniref:cysteine hydrolase family protein n=1 Tax=Adlercreutzia wanghongyangiae TaxID=3111451 RepID=UPI002DBEFEDB|nr:isochorismatase family cysteine hydrolase [Adlercreutzia sp. R21]MEC4185428.1 isochorismatase family cysteine hydrolase [Adlercreutzia sp. R21]
MLGDENNNDLVDLSAIDRLRCALLVIDELGDPTGTPLEPVLLPSIQQTAKLAEAARKVGMPVVFTNDAHIPGIDRELTLWGTHGIAGTPEAQTSPLLNPQPTDYVVEKRRYSGFFQTGLLLLLNELGVDTLICCGMDTNICVKHTVADAYFNNFNIIVVGDATATFLVGDQAEGLDYMRTCYAAKIIDTDEAVKLIEA